MHGGNRDHASLTCHGSHVTQVWQASLSCCTPRQQCSGQAKLLTCPAPRLSPYSAGAGSARTSELLDCLARSPHLQQCMSISAVLSPSSCKAPCRSIDMQQAAAWRTVKASCLAGSSAHYKADMVPQPSPTTWQAKEGVQASAPEHNGCLKQAANAGGPADSSSSLLSSQPSNSVPSALSGRLSWVSWRAQRALGDGLTRSAHQAQAAAVTPCSCEVAAVHPTVGFAASCVLAVQDLLCSCQVVWAPTHVDHQQTA